MIRFREISALVVFASAFLALYITACEWLPFGPNRGFDDPSVIIKTVDLNPSWSHAGNQFVYWSILDSVGNNQRGLYLSDTSGNRKDFTGFGGMGVWAEWLPGDSELIVNNGQLHRFNLNTKQDTPLGIFPRFPPFDVSSDGKFIYFEGPKLDSLSAGGIYRYDLLSDTTVAVVSGVHPAISLNGETLAFSRSPLYTFSLVDSSIALISVGGILPEWIGNEKILYYAGGSIHRADTLGQTVVLTSAWSSKISANQNSTVVLFTRGSSDSATHIWGMKEDGSGLFQITR